MNKKDLEHFKHQRTLVVIKPDGVQRSLIGEITSRYEKIGLKLVGMKMLVVDADHIEKHYTFNPEWKKNVGEKSIAGYKKKGLKPPSENPVEVGDAVLDRLKRYLVAGPVVAMVWQGAHAVEIVRKLTGNVVEPLVSDVGTIRGDFMLDSFEMADADDRSVRNLVHASGEVDEAEAEIKLWFSDEELVDYNHVQDQILYDVDLDGILE